MKVDLQTVYQNLSNETKIIEIGYTVQNLCSFEINIWMIFQKEITYSFSPIDFLFFFLSIMHTKEENAISDANVLYDMRRTLVLILQFCKLQSNQQI